MSLPNPITRKEQYLAKAAGESVSIPEEPLTREEMYLEKIAEGGGGGGGTSNYNDLSHLPTVNGVEFKGTMSGADIGLVDAEEGKGLSTNDYDNTAKGIVEGITSALSGKQDTISDLNTIRSGASEGATAYQKPGSGIPKTDLAEEVQTSLGKADTAIQDISGKQDTLTIDNEGYINL